MPFPAAISRELWELQRRLGEFWSEFVRNGRCSRPVSLTFHFEPMEFHVKRASRFNRGSVHVPVSFSCSSPETPFPTVRNASRHESAPAALLRLGSGTQCGKPSLGKRLGTRRRMDSSIAVSDSLDTQKPLAAMLVQSAMSASTGCLVPFAELCAVNRCYLASLDIDTSRPSRPRISLRSFSCTRGSARSALRMMPGISSTTTCFQ